MPTAQRRPITAPPGGGERFAFGDFLLDCADERLWGPVGVVRIGNKAFRVLCALVRNPDRLVTKDELFESVWDGTAVSESVLTTVIKELRRALGDEKHDPRFISTAYGRGYRFIAAVDAGAASAVDRPGTTGAEGRPPIVLVSAFDDSAVQTTHPYLAAGLREEILSGLARFREIQLVADERSAAEAGAAFGRAGDRDYQLIATLLPDGEGVKIVARVKRLADGRVVWADRMALADTGTAGGVETIVRRIVGETLPAVDEDLLLGLPRETDDFYDTYLVAKRRSFVARDFDEARAAADALERLIAERPGFALAYAPLVRLYNTDFGYTGLGSTGPPERERALELARAGLAADPSNVHAYTVLGFCHLWHEDGDLARDCFDRALALNPYNAMRLNEVAAGLIYLGEFDGARALLQQSLQLQPLVNDLYYEDRTRLALLEGDRAEAASLVRRMGAERLWTNLYAALCEVEGEAGRARLASWLAGVETRWAGPGPASIDGIRRWIAFHHPLAPELKARLMALVERGFETLRPARPRIRAPARG